MSENVADYLARGLGMGDLDQPPTKLDLSTRCLITGETIVEGYRPFDAVPNTLGEYLDLFPSGFDGYISVNVAKSFKNSWNLGNRLIFEDGTHYNPLIARDTKGERPHWSKLLRDLYPERVGQGVCAILVSDVKKRVWPKARVGVFGRNTPIFVYDASWLGVNRNVYCDVKIVIEMLDFVERVYDLGFPKTCIGTNLFDDFASAETTGFQETSRLESELRTMRNQDEFIVSVLVAQHQEGWKKPKKQLKKVTRSNNDNGIPKQKALF